jgi:hypothetical protein
LIVGDTNAAALELKAAAKFRFSNTKYILDGDAMLNGVPTSNAFLEKLNPNNYGVTEKLTMDIDSGTLTIAGDVTFVLKGTTLKIAAGAKLEGKTGAKIEIKGTTGSVTGAGVSNFYADDGITPAVFATDKKFRWDDSINNPNGGWKAYR